jgi:hypothetical protein
MRGDAQPTNIGNPDEYTVKQLAEIVIELTRSSSEIVYEELPTDDPKVRKPDISRARRNVGVGAEGAGEGGRGAYSGVLSRARVVDAARPRGAPAPRRAAESAQEPHELDQRYQAYDGGQRRS